MKVRLNLATAPLENQRRFVLGAVLAGGLALGLLVVLSLQTYRNWRASRDLRAEVSRLQSELRDFRARSKELEDFFDTPGARRVMDRAGFFNNLIEQRSFPWTKIFMDLEHRLPRGVRVVSIAPSLESGRVEVKLVVGASSDENKILFLKALEDSPEFSRVQVLSESRATLPSETDKVLVEVVAWYKSVLPEAGAESGQPAEESREARPVKRTGAA